MEEQRRCRNLRDQQILDLVNDSEFDFSSDDSEDDPTYKRNHNRNCSSSPSDEFSENQDFSEPERTESPNIPIPSPSSSILGRGRASRSRIRGSLRGRGGRSRGRQGRGRRPATGSRNLTDAWERDSFEPTIHPMHSPNYVERDISSMEWYDFFDDYIDNEILETMVMATNQTNVLKKGKYGFYYRGAEGILWNFISHGSY
ncbi:unnamed protein product [Parnassius mnemosyne]|uniref:Acetyl-CoA carboxylase beta subunit n=1 Tax=Parnassius mnemosyne TaxID=213953 RepID=A0AAV1KME4_9NEOP